ncbi:MAG: hypothetical protein Q4D41_08825, partial [Prevotellaceae bacterium]|nr:hypothetical protein [Prevotellaceae bacterium]
LYSKEFASSVLNIIALCDVSLMNSLPGAQFVTYLARIKNGQIPIPQKPEDVYDYFLNNHNYMDKLKEITEKTRHHFKGILKDPKAFEHYHGWIDNAFEQTLKLRKDNPYFILELLRGGKILNNSIFLSLYASFGTPLIRNNKNEYSKIPLIPKDKQWDVEFMQPIKHLSNILKGGAYPCLLKRWCESSALELEKMGADPNIICYVDERCDKNPSLRSLDKIRCPLGFVWYATGLPLLKSK